jgi:hypothetical protein
LKHVNTLAAARLHVKTARVQRGPQIDVVT